MKKCIHRTFATAFAAAAACGVVWAGPPLIMDMLDRNDDGVIGFDEFSAVPVKHFQRMDADRDGFVSAAEREAARSDRVKRMGQQATEGAIHAMPGLPGLDGDGDGQVSFAEFENSLRARFAATDTSQDGFIDAAESAEANADMPPLPFQPVRN